MPRTSGFSRNHMNKMIKTLVFTVVFGSIIVTLIGCSKTDPIERVVSRRLASSAYFASGMWPILSNSVDASPEQLVADVLRNKRFDKGKLSTYKILTIRRMIIQGDNYTAVLVDTNLGRCIIFFYRPSPRARGLSYMCFDEGGSLL